MDGPSNYTKWSNSDKDKYHTVSFISGIWKKDTNEFIYKAETDPQTENKVVGTKGESGWGRGTLGD